MLARRSYMLLAMLFNIPLNQITEDHIEALAKENVAEGQHIDYKKELHVDVDRTKDEFRKDVIAFANASGGDIVYGVEEKPSGIAHNVCGIPLTDADATKRSLHQILSAHVRPRLPSVTIEEIPLHGKNPALIVRVPASFVRPHRVEIQESTRRGDLQFWVRHQSQNMRMDVDELGHAFGSTQSSIDRIRDFRADRLSRLVNNDSPIPMEEQPKVVLHLVPTGAFLLDTKHDVRKAASALNRRTTWGINYRYNFEGFLAWLNMPATRYVQVFRHGSLEAAGSDSPLLNVREQYVPSFAFEQHFISTLPELLAVQEELGVSPPILIMLSLIGIENFRLAVQGGLSPLIGRAVVPLSEVLVDRFDCDPAIVLKPVFDMLWNAAGYEGCANYDADGNRTR
jgi:hypothetical protein